MTKQIVEANDFKLGNNDTQIYYLVESFIGKPQLIYKTPKLDLQFEGEEIRVLETEIGKLVTVTVERPPNPDVGGEVITITLLLPVINLSANFEISIQTEAVLTTKLQQGFINNPPEGQLQTYEILSLAGTASLVNT
jgi:hypothetical protein